MAETAQQKVEKDLKTLPKSVPTPKPLNYTGNPDPEVQGTRFGNLELRADLDSRMALMPIARLGYDIIERGLLDPQAGEMGGEIVPRFRPPGMEGNVLGMAMPSKRLNPDDRIFDTDYFKENPEIRSITAQDLNTYGKGLESLLSSDRGSTVLYDASIDRDQALNVLMEELAHIGVRELARRGIDVPNVSTEERAMDMLQARLSLSEGLDARDEDQARDMETVENKYISKPRNILDDFNEAASAVLAERGVPPRAKRRDTKEDSGMVSNMLKFFGVK